MRTCHVPALQLGTYPTACESISMGVREEAEGDRATLTILLESLSEQQKMDAMQVTILQTDLPSPTCLLVEKAVRARSCFSK